MAPVVLKIVYFIAQAQQLDAHRASIEAYGNHRSGGAEVSAVATQAAAGGAGVSAAATQSAAIVQEAYDQQRLRRRKEASDVVARQKPQQQAWDVGHESRVDKGKSVLYDNANLERWGGGSANFGSKPGHVTANRRWIHLPGGFGRPIAEEMRLMLKKMFPPSQRRHTQVPGPKDFKAAVEYSADHLGISDSSGRGDQRKVMVNSAAREGDSGEAESKEVHIVVPDPDFHDFDADRTEAHVKKNQVWAVYDETDGMPRFYCLVKKVNQHPFNVEGVWLEPVHPQRDTSGWFEKLKFSSGSGEFRLGDECECTSINMFSHLVGTNKNSIGLYELYPSEGEVWALFRDDERGTVSINAVTGRVENLCYDYVLVQAGFLTFTGQGRVMGLRKLGGYTTLWIPHGEAYLLTDLYRFSHRVPAFFVSDSSMEGVPAGCLELDPAATPEDAINPGTT